MRRDRTHGEPPCLSVAANVVQPSGECPRGVLTPPIDAHGFFDVWVGEANLASAVDRLHVAAELLRDAFAVDEVYARDTKSPFGLWHCLSPYSGRMPNNLHHY